MDAIVSAASSASSLKQLAEGKTKTIFAIDGHPGKVLIRSKDSLTAFNAQRQNNIEGKAAVATQTTANVFRYLAKCGIPNHFVVSVDETAFVAEECEMVPIEWVARRVAAGSFLKRHKGVQQGFRFNPPAIESFFKDDAAGDPEWTDEEILSANFVFNGLHIKKPEIALMHRLTDLVFRALEKAWARAECTLVDMKIEFGVTATGRLVLADVVDNDSWRVWPKGQAEQQLDKQFYRDLKEVTKNDLDEVLAKYQRVERLTADFVNVSFTPRVLIVMGSGKDLPFAQKIAEKAADYHLSPVLRVSSAHKTTRETLDLLAEYEDDGVPTVVIAVAGRSNGLGPVLAANSSHLVINCPPPSATAKEDLWSSMSMPSGIGCVTVLSPEEAALAAAKSLSSVNHLIYGRLLGEQIASALAVYEGDREATAAVSQ